MEQFTPLTGILIIALLLLTALCAILINKKEARDKEIHTLKTQPFYTRSELVEGKMIYDKNYLEDPEGFTDVNGSREDAEICVDYLIGIIQDKRKGQ